MPATTRTPARRPGFLQPDPVQACLTCHSDQSDQMKKAHLHQPAGHTGCATCHEPHGGDNEHLLRASTTNELCLECHGPDAASEEADGEHLVTIFNGKVKLPEDYFRKVTLLPIKYGRGHPVDRHPVSDVDGPVRCQQGPEASQLLDLSPAALFGAARSAGERPGQQHGILHHLPYEFDEVGVDMERTITKAMKLAAAVAGLALFLALADPTALYAGSKKKKDTAEPEAAQHS